jgi:hypothetical protein
MRRITGRAARTKLDSRSGSRSGTTNRSGARPDDVERHQEVAISGRGTSPRSRPRSAGSTSLVAGFVAPVLRAPETTMIGSFFHDNVVGARPGRVINGDFRPRCVGPAPK